MKISFDKWMVKTTILMVLFLMLVACSAAADRAPAIAPTGTQPPATSTATDAAPTRSPTAELTATTTDTLPPPTATKTEAPEEEPEETEFLDFSAIEGKWSGELEEAGGISSWIEIDLSSGSQRSDPVGTVSHGLVEGITSCSGTWFAISAQDTTYRVREEITEGDTCHNGIVRLELDTQTGTLLYDFTPIISNPLAEASGTLMRSE